MGGAGGDHLDRGFKLELSMSVSEAARGLGDCFQSRIP